MASFADLDDALLEQVASHLPLEDLCRACRVCSRLRAVIMGAQDVWRSLFDATYGTTSSSGGAQQAQAPPPPQQQSQAATPGASGRHAASTSQAQEPRASSGRPPGSVPAVASLPLDSGSSGRQLGKRRREGDGEPSEAHAMQAAGTVAQAAEGAAAQAAAAAAGAAATPAAAAATPAAAGPSLESGSWRERFKARYVEESRKQRLKRQARRLKAESALQVLRLEVHRLEQSLAAEQRQLPQLQAQLAAVQKARQQASAAALAQVYWQPVAVQQAHGQGVAAVQQPLDAEGAEQDLQQRVAVSQLEVRKLTAALAAARRRAGDAQRKLQALLP